MMAHSWCSSISLLLAGQGRRLNWTHPSFFSNSYRPLESSSTSRFIDSIPLLKDQQGRYHQVASPDDEIAGLDDGLLPFYIQAAEKGNNSSHGCELAMPKTHHRTLQSVFVPSLFAWAPCLNGSPNSVILIVYIVAYIMCCWVFHALLPLV